MTKWLKIGLRGVHQNVAQHLNSLPAKFGDEIRRGPRDKGFKFFDYPALYLGNGAR